MLPPPENLRRFIREGADLVTFSGGKGLRGPQSSGILAGRRDLIRAARLNGSPHHSIGRPGKAAKEDIVGLLTALELFERRDHAADLRLWRAQASLIAERLGGMPGVRTRVLHDEWEHLTPQAELILGADSGVDAHALVRELEEGTPRIFVFEPTGPTAVPNSVIVYCMTMLEGQEEVVADALVDVLRRRHRGTDIAAS
jgi:seryl-tRNA(Sec) selenium transferase